MKALQKLIIKAFIPPFVITFLITWFVFIMQFFWLYIDDLVGKGLEVSIILKLILYLAPTLIPLALPLGVLLAGIMTLGNIAESNELTAIKSSGISLQKFMRPLFIIVFILSVGAFLFNNYVIPVANLKFYTLLSDIRSKKPAVNIKAGFFYNEIPGYSIYISKKEADNKTINDVMIYDHTSGSGNEKLVLAKQGKMYISNDEKFLIFELKNGWRYEERKDKKNPNYNDQIRMGFKFWKKVFDLSSFEMQKSKEDYLKSNEAMLSNAQLGKYIDTTYIDKKKFAKRNNEIVSPIITIIKNDTTNKFNYADKISSNQILKKSILERCSDSLKRMVIQNAESNIRNAISLFEININDHNILNMRQAKLRVEWHKKITYAIACFILFLVGAPLGAIIKKGGFGLPIVFAVCFFVIYHFLNVAGEKMSKELVLDPNVGMWMANIILFTIASFLLYKATTDSPVMNKEWYSRNFEKIITIFKKRKTNA